MTRLLALTFIPNTVEFPSPKVYNSKDDFVFSNAITKSQFETMGVSIIQLTKLFIASLSKPEQLTAAATLKKGKVFLYFLFIAFISAIPAFLQSYQLLTDFNRDGQTIISEMPEFSIKNGEFITDEPIDSFSKKTHSINFVFDPEGTKPELEEDLSENLVGIGFLKDGLHFNNASQPISLTYQQMDGLSKEFFVNILASMQRMTGFILVIAFILMLLLSLFLTLLFNFLYTVFANLVTALTRRRLPFSDVFKMTLFASTLPTIIFTLFNLFGLRIAYQTELSLIVTVYLYYLALRTLPKPE